MAQKLPGLTPKKRGAPAPPPPDLGGQIQKPGAAQELPVTPPPDAVRRRHSKKAAKAAAASGSDRSSGDSPNSDVEVVELPLSALALMPAELGFGPAFDALVAAACSRSWIATDRMEQGIPARYLSCLYRARLWTSKELDAYDKMIRRQTGRGSRREDPRRVAFPHRLSLVFTTDDDLMINAEHIRLLCEGERISDWAGEAGRRLGGHTARAAYTLLLDQLREAWTWVNSASRRLEHVGGPAIQYLIDQFTILLERRYARFAIVLTAGHAREEVLANIARQLGELRTYFAAFSQNMADRAGRLPNAEQAVFAGERYVNLFTPSMKFLLGEDGGPIPGGI